MRLMLTTLLFLATTVVGAQELNLIPGTTPAPAPGPANVALLVGSPDDFELPETAIVGADHQPVKFGKIVSLKVKPINKRPTTLYSVTYLWRLHPTPDDLIVLGDNTQAIFGAGVDDNTVNVELIASYLFLSKDKASGKPVVAQRLVVVDKDIIIGGGTPPEPPPGPGPPGPPVPPPAPDQPVLPDTKFGLTKKVYSWMMSVSLPADVRKKDALALARSFKGIAQTVTSQVEYNNPNGTHYPLDTPSKLLAATKTSNNAAIPQTIQQWRPWFANLQAELKALQADGAIPAVQDYSAAWVEIANGLEAAAR